MPKYSFKRNLFFAIWGGSVTDSGLPTTPHIHYVGCTVHCVGRTEYDKKYLVNTKIFLSVLAFSRVSKFKLSAPGENKN